MTIRKGTTASGAVFSDDEVYRYSLWREWDEYNRKGALCFVMLNPSTADETVLDPTIRRCIGFAKREGHGGAHIINLFALRSTDPANLYEHRAPIGPENNSFIEAAGDSYPDVVVAWGAHGVTGRIGELGLTRASMVATLLRGCNLWCLGKTKDGSPRHPLYVPAIQPFERWGDEKH